MLESLNNIQNKKFLDSVVALLRTREADNCSGEKDFPRYVNALKDNLSTIEKFTKEHGWPSQNNLIKQGISPEDALMIETSAFLCVQHADSNIRPLKKTSPNDWQPKLSNIASKQKEILKLMQEEKANPAFIAYLTDRIARNEQKPQEYLTQFEKHPEDKNTKYKVTIDQQIEKIKKDSPKDSKLINKLIKKRANTGLFEPKPWFIGDNKQEPFQFLPQNMLASMYDGRLNQALDKLPQTLITDKFNLVQPRSRSVSKNTKQKSWVEKMKSTTPSGNREL